jgi:hypothetical protein
MLSPVLVLVGTGGGWAYPYDSFHGKQDQRDSALIGISRVGVDILAVTISRMRRG